MSLKILVASLKFTGHILNKSKHACKQPCSVSCVVDHVPYDRELIAFPSL